MIKQELNIEKLLKLSKENSGLRIIPIINKNIVQNNDFNYWLGSIDDIYIDEICQSKEKTFLRSIDEEDLINTYIDVICDTDYYEKRINDEDIKKVREKAEKLIKQLKWEQVIVIKIEIHKN